MINAHISIKMFWLLCLSNKIIAKQHFLVEYDRKTAIYNFFNQGDKNYKQFDKIGQEA